MAASSLMSVLMILMTADFILEMFSSSYKATKTSFSRFKRYATRLPRTTRRNNKYSFGKNHNKALEDGKIAAGYEAAGAIRVFRECFS